MMTEYVKAFDFRIPAEGSTHVSSSSGIFFDVVPGPMDTGISQMIATSQQQAIAGEVMSESVGFAGLYARGGSSVQLACTYCNGLKSMDWPWGTISEPKGEVANARECIFRLTGGERIKDLVNTKRMIIVTVHSIDLDSNETLTVSYGDFVATFREGSHAPAEFHLPTYSLVSFSAPEYLSEGAQWNLLSQGVRFKMTYRTIILTNEGWECTVSCMKNGRYDEACVRSNGCATMSREISLDGVNVIKDLETDFGNDDVTRRAYTVDGKKWQATEQQPRTESRTGSRADHSHPNRLAMSLSGYGGKDQDVPCKLAQNTKQILMDLEQVSGWNGLWRGQCALKDSCVQAERGKDCIFDESYAAANNTCSVDFHISDQVVREYRFDCSGANGFVGMALGYITSVGDVILEQSMNTDVTILAYRRISILWTKSNLNDRPVGAEIPGVISFGVRTEWQPDHTRMQIVLGTDTGREPDLPVDAPNSRFSSKYGACRSMEFRPLDTKILLAPQTALKVEGAGVVGQLMDANRYMKCNRTLQKIQDLEKSARCKDLLEILLYRDVNTAFVLPEGTCENPCLEQVNAVLQQAKLKCSRLWKGTFYTDMFKKRFYKKLYLVASASTYADIVCDRNHKGEHCFKSISDFSFLFQDCPIFSSVASQLADDAFNVNALKTNDRCPQACYEALQR